MAVFALRLLMFGYLASQVGVCCSTAPHRQLLSHKNEMSRSKAFTVMAAAGKEFPSAGLRICFVLLCQERTLQNLKLH